MKQTPHPFHTELPRQGSLCLACALVLLLTGTQPACAGEGNTASYQPRPSLSIPQSSGGIGLLGTSQESVYEQTPRPVKKAAASRPHVNKKKKTAAAPVPTPAADANKQAWAFGGGRSAEAAKNGISGSTLYDKARPAARQTKPADDETAIHPAGSKKKDGFNVKVRKEDQSWNAGMTPSFGENISMDRKHRVEAFAGVKEDNVSFGVGPELLVHDSDKVNSHGMGRSDQPDVEAGIGMRLNVDF